MVKVNGMGKTCPIPLIETKKAVKALTSPDTIEVMVGNLSVDDDNIDTLSNIKYVIGYVYLDNKKLKQKLHIKSSWGFEEL